MGRNGAVLPQLALDGVPAPPESIEPPCSSPWWAQICRACFWDANTERAIGFGGVGPIPWSKIRAWGESRRLRRDHLLVLEHIVRRMDGAYLDHQRAIAKAEARGKE